MRLCPVFADPVTSRLTVVSRAAKKLQSARPIKRRAATTVSYLRVGPVSQYQS